MPSNQSVVLCAVEASHGSCGKPVETNLAELAGTDFSTLCRRQKTLSIAIPYQGAGEPLHLLTDSTAPKGRVKASGIPASMAD